MSIAPVWAYAPYQHGTVIQALSQHTHYCGFTGEEASGIMRTHNGADLAEFLGALGTEP